MSLENHLALVEWVSSQHGYLHPDVELAFDMQRGYHARVMAGSTIEAGTCVAKSSMSTSLSVLNAWSTSPFSCRGTQFPSAFLGNHPVAVVQCFFLMEQWILQEKSWWAPYLQTLPRPEEMELLHLTDKDEDLAGLRGTGLQSAMKQQYGRWKAWYSAGMSQLVELEWPNALTNKYTWDLFRWACIMFGSRSFTSRVLSNTLPADKARPMGHSDPDHDLLSDLFETGFAVLLPLLDLLNYRPLSRVEWQPGLNHVGLHMLDRVEAGQEVCNNYGPRDNEILMLGYGFSIPANPFDQVAVGLKVPADSPLAEARAKMMTEPLDMDAEARNQKEYRYHIFNLEHPRAKSATYLETSIFSQDLFDSVSVLAANFRELQSHTFRSKGYVLGADPKRLAGRRQHRNLLQTLFQMRLECSARLVVLRTNIAQLTDACPASISQKEQYANVYMHSQLTILETASVLCRYCLLRAQKPGQQKLDLIASAAFAERILKTSEAKQNVEILVQRTPAAVQAGTLFGFSDAVSLLPGGLAVRIHRAASACVESVKERVGKCVAQPFSGYELEEKIGFMVFLVALRRIFSEGFPTLSSRLNSWVMTLHKWFPFNDAFWSSPTEEFLPILEVLVETAVLSVPDADNLALEEALSDCAILCWAWNVQEEEGLFTDTDASDTKDGVGCQPSQFLLFIPKEPRTSEVTL